MYFAVVSVIRLNINPPKIATAIAHSTNTGNIENACRSSGWRFRSGRAFCSAVFSFPDRISAPVIYLLTVCTRTRVPSAGIRPARVSSRNRQRDSSPFCRLTGSTRTLPGIWTGPPAYRNSPSSVSAAPSSSIFVCLAAVRSGRTRRQYSRIQIIPAGIMEASIAMNMARALAVRVSRHMVTNASSMAAANSRNTSVLRRERAFCSASRVGLMNTSIGATAVRS